MLQHTVTHCITLQHLALVALCWVTKINALAARPATHCNALQLNATHCPWLCSCEALVSGEDKSNDSTPSKTLQHVATL